MTLRAIEVLRIAVERMLTPASAPIVAAAGLVIVVALAGASVSWGDMRIGAQRASAANVDSDEGGDMPASVGPEPAP